MNGGKRNSGINLIGDIPWGTHFCQFYEAPEDLTDILVPYFKAGLENNEYCMWVTSEPLQVGEARAALKKVVTNLDDYVKKGQIEIVPHDQWYLKGGVFDLQKVLGSWIDKLDHALKQGYDGLRVTGNTAWLEKKDWKSFTKYEEEINRVIGNYRVIAICTYSLDRCSAAQVIDVVSNHQFALIRRQGQWQLLESTEHRQVEKALRRSEENFRRSLDDSPLGIRIITADGELIYANQTMLDIYGYDSIEELKTTPTKKRCTPKSYAEHLERVEKRRRGEYVTSNYESSIVRKDGEIRHLEVFRKEVLWNGETQFQVLYNDITEHKQLEAEIVHLASFPELNPTPVVELDQKGNIKYLNAAAGSVFSDLATLGVNHPFLADWVQVVKELQSGNWANTVVREVAIDSLVYEQTIAPVSEKHVHIYGRDITERKRAEEALRESEQRYRTLFESAAEGILIADAETKKLRYANPAICTMLGYGQEELMKMGVGDIHPKTSLEHVLTEFAAQARGEKALSSGLPCLKKDGTVIYADINAAKAIIDGRECNIGFFADITERKEAEEALRNSEERYHRLVENLQEGIWAIDKDSRTSSVNPRMAEMLGYTADEMLGRHLFSFMDEHGVQIATRLLEHRKQGIKEQRDFEFVRKDGARIYTVLETSPITDDNGNYIGALAGVVDITERRKAEENLRASEQRFRNLTEHTSDWVWEIDADGVYTYSNPKVKDMIGYEPEEVIGKTPLDFMSPEEARRVAAEFKAVTKARKPFTGLENTNLHKDGRPVVIETGGVPVFNSEGQFLGYHGINRDVTERNRLQEELQRSETFESIGTLAGGIAHDFNNILTGILGNITLAERCIEPEGEVAKRLLEAKKASLRAKDLTQQLLTFSRGGAPIKELASIAELLEESALFALRGSNVRCEFSLPDDLWSVEIDRGQMSQVVTNLVINAKEAMPEGGLLHIVAKNTVIERNGASPLPEGDYIEITVEDHGVGIPKENLGRIFDPYFTTKKKGTGLGLTTTYSIIKRHNGYITFESEPGAGTTLRIYLPASKKPVTRKEVEMEAVQAAFLDRKGILVMDDEEMIREMLSNMLSTAGYQVELASAGEEAIERYEKARKSGHPFDAVILDLTVPGGMGGKEAIKELLKMDPDVKAIVSSGYATDPIMADFRKYGFSAVVTKPYGVAEMERTLHRILSQGKEESLGRTMVAIDGGNGGSPLNTRHFTR